MQVAASLGTAILSLVLSGDLAVIHFSLLAVWRSQARRNFHCPNLLPQVSEEAVEQFRNCQTSADRPGRRGGTALMMLSTINHAFDVWRVQGRAADDPSWPIGRSSRAR
jgi:hypothetical protein